MAYMTVADLLDECVTLLSEVSGSAVQTYSEDRIIRMIRRQYNRVHKVRWWGHLMKWEQRMPNGTDGHTTLNQSANDYDDVRAVFRSDWDRPLPELPKEVNPFRLMGTTVRYISPNNDVDGQVFIVYPLTALDAGGLAISHRSYPTDFDNNTVIPFDVDVLTNGAVWEYCCDDGFNSTQIQKFKDLSDSRLVQLTDDYDRKPILLDPRIVQVPDQWRGY